MGEAFIHKNEHIKDGNYTDQTYHYASVTNCTFTDTLMVRMQIQNCVPFPNHILKDTKWERCSFNDASFTLVTFEQDSFIKCSMINLGCDTVEFISVSMDDCNCTTPKPYWKHIIFQGCTFTKVLFCSNHMNRSDIENTVFDNCDFTDTSLRSASIWSTKFENSTFVRTDFTEANIGKCEFHGCKFEYNTLNSIVNCTFVNCDFSNIKFGKPNSCTFENCKFYDTEFEGITKSTILSSHFYNIKWIEKTDGDFSNCEFHDTLFEKEFRGSVQLSQFYQTGWKGKTDSDFSNCEFHDILFEKEFRGNINSSQFYQTRWKEETDGDLTNCEFHEILFEKEFRGNINSSRFYQTTWKEKTDSDFSDCNFFNTEFEKGIQGATLSGKFYNTQLHQVAGCKFSNCRFYNDGSISVFKTITSCTFESCTLEKNDFTKIAVTNTLFSNNIFNGILMTWASMKENTFKSLEMNGGSAESFNFEEIDLETPGKFHNVTMKECNFSSLVLDGWEFSGCILTGSNFNKSHLLKADFKGASLGSVSEGTSKTTSFVGAYLGIVDFQEAKLFGVNFSDCHTYIDSKVNFTSADAQSAKFINAFLYGCEFTQIRARSSDFTGAVLIGNNFSKAHFDGLSSGIETNLAGIFLAGCKFTEATMNHATLTDGMIAEHGGFLFHLPDSLWDELKDSAGSKNGVRKEFENHCMPLDDSACFIKIETMPEAGWKVIDEKRERVLYYIDRQVPGSIGVYRTMGIFLLEAPDKEEWRTLLNKRKIPEELILMLQNNKIALKGTVRVQQINEQWEIRDNEQGNHGFLNYCIVREGDLIRVYGRHVRMMCSDEAGHIEYKTFAFDATGLFPIQFGTKTSCPNGQTFEEPDDSEGWKRMLRSDKFSWPKGLSER